MPIGTVSLILRPYTPNCRRPHTWSVPVGLWQPAHVGTSGPVLIESFNVFPTVIQPTWSAPVARVEAAELRLVIGLRNLTTTPHEVYLHVTVEPHNFGKNGGSQPEGHWMVKLEGQEGRRCEFTLLLPQPHLWFPWTHGQSWLYRAKLTLESSTLDQTIQVFGFREVRAVIEPNRWEWWLNGRRIFPKGSNYVSDFYLDRVSGQSLAHDVELGTRGKSRPPARPRPHWPA